MSEESSTPQEESPTEFDENEKKAAQLVNQLRGGKKLHDKFAKQFRDQYKISGKLMSEWKDYFRIKLPADLNPQLCQEMDSILMEKHQEASFLKAEVEARLTALRSACNDTYRTRYTELVTEYKVSKAKLPAKDTLATLAEESMSLDLNARVHSEIELAFWKEVLADLQNSRKLVDNATLNLSVEAKALQHQQYIDKLSRRHGEGYND